MPGLGEAKHPDRKEACDLQQSAYHQTVKGQAWLLYSVSYKHTRTRIISSCREMIVIGGRRGKLRAKRKPADVARLWADPCPRQP